MPVRRCRTSTGANGGTQRTRTARILLQRSARRQSLSVATRQLSSGTESEYYCGLHKSFLTHRYSCQWKTQEALFFYLEMHQKAFGGRPSDQTRCGSLRRSPRRSLTPSTRDSGNGEREGTDRQTDRPRYLVCNNRPHLRT